MSRAASVAGHPSRVGDPHDSASAVWRAVTGFDMSVFYYSYGPARACPPPCLHAARGAIHLDFGHLQRLPPTCPVIHTAREALKETGGGAGADPLSREDLRGALDAFEELLQETVCPSPEEVGTRLAATVAEIPEALAVAVAAFGRAFRIRTVIQSYDMDVCQQVYAGERRLYEVYPDLEAEFRVLTERQTEGQLALAGIGYDFVSTRDEW